MFVVFEMPGVGMLFSSIFFFFKQKTAYEIRPCDWSSDVCSSDLGAVAAPARSSAASRAASNRSSTECLWLCVWSRSEERRVGKECTGLCGSPWLPVRQNKKKDLVYAAVRHDHDCVHEAVPVE